MGLAPDLIRLSNSSKLNYRIPKTVRRLRDGKIIQEWHALSMKCHISKIEGSFSLRQCHFGFLVMAALSSLTCLNLSNQWYPTRVIALQRAFQKLRPAPNAETPYDHKLIHTIFRYEANEIVLSLMLESGYDLLLNPPGIPRGSDRFRDLPTLSFRLGMIHFYVERDQQRESLRTLAEAPLQGLSKPGNPKAKPVITTDCYLRPSMIMMALGASSIFNDLLRKPAVTKRLGAKPRTNRLECDIMPIGLVWDSILYDMAGYGLLVSKQMKKITRVVNLPASPKRRSMNNSIPTITPLLLRSNIKRYDSEDLQIEVPCTPYVPVPPSPHRSVNHVERILTVLRLIRLNISIAPIKACFPLADKFHIRQHNSQFASAGCMIFKFPNIKLSVSDIVQLSIKGLEIFSTAKSSVSSGPNSFDEYMRQGPDTQFSSIIRNYNAHIHCEILRKTNEELQGTDLVNIVCQSGEVHVILTSATATSLGLVLHTISPSRMMSRFLIQKPKSTRCGFPSTPGLFSTPCRGGFPPTPGLFSTPCIETHQSFYLPRPNQEQNHPAVPMTGVLKRVEAVTFKFFPEVTTLNPSSHKLEMAVCIFEIRNVELPRLEFDNRLSPIQAEISLGRVCVKLLNHTTQTLSQPTDQIFLSGRFYAIFHRKQIQATGQVIYFQLHVEPMSLIINPRITDIWLKMTKRFTPDGIPNDEVFERRQTLARSLSYWNLSRHATGDVRCSLTQDNLNELSQSVAPFMCHFNLEEQFDKHLDIWACVKIEGIQIGIPSLPSGMTEGFAIEFKRFWLHTTSLNCDVRGVSPVKYGKMCSKCQNLVDWSKIQISTTGAGSCNSQEMEMLSKLEGFKMYRISYSVPESTLLEEVDMTLWKSFAGTQWTNTIAVMSKFKFNSSNSPIWHDVDIDIDFADIRGNISTTDFQMFRTCLTTIALDLTYLHLLSKHIESNKKPQELPEVIYSTPKERLPSFLDLLLKVNISIKAVLRTLSLSLYPSSPDDPTGSLLLNVYDLFTEHRLVHRTYEGKGHVSNISLVFNPPNVKGTLSLLRFHENVPGRNIPKGRKKAEWPKALSAQWRQNLKLDPDAELSLEVVGFDLVLPLPVAELVLTASYKSRERITTPLATKCRTNSYLSPDVLEVMAQIAPNTNSQKIKVIVYGGVIAVTTDLCSVDYLTE
jgi:hypothetical protein